MRILAVLALAAALAASACDRHPGKPLSNTFPLPHDQAAREQEPRPQAAVAERKA